MADDRRAWLRRRYLSLGVGELFAAAVFAGVAAIAVTPRIDDPDGQRALWAALVPLLAVLVQAGTYWLLARGWVERGPMPASLRGLYQAFRVADVVLLLAGLIGVLVWRPGGSGMTVLLVVATWLFAVVEYVNYFVVRLAYPASHWSRMVRQWRTPRLVQDVRSTRAMAQSSRSSADGT
ncbi:MAG: hypothetical protein L0H26_00060 [Microlunatus sp.]|nr:hypothetical protein [Microlunatus sp.]